MRHIPRALERLRRIKPRSLPSSEVVAGSSCRLVQEYLRRVAEWAFLTGQLTGLDARDALKLDLAELFAPGRALPPAFDPMLQGLSLGSLGTVVARNYVRWEYVADDPVVAGSGLSEPYEPLVRLFERGGELFTHHGFIHVSHCGSVWPGPLPAYADLEPLADLTDEALDRFDRP